MAWQSAVANDPLLPEELFTAGSTVGKEHGSCGWKL
jgi:hypothetical protein